MKSTFRGTEAILNFGLESEIMRTFMLNLDSDVEAVSFVSFSLPLVALPLPTF